MSYRTIGKSNLKLSAITFGAWAVGGWMWGGSDTNDAIEAMKAAYDHGITSIDTAPAYGQGDSEILVGEAIKGIPRDKVQIMTKFGMRWDLPDFKGPVHSVSKDNNGNEIKTVKYAGKESVIYEAEQSLKRLKTDYIDLYQIHWPDETTPMDETFEAVIRLQEQGKIIEAGVSNYNAAQTAEAKDLVNLVSNQVSYSVLRREIEDELVPYALKNNISIIAYSPLERGLLTGKITPGYKFNEGDHRATRSWFIGDNLVHVNHFLDQIRPIAADKKVTLAQLLLRWTIDQPGIAVALAGARNAKQAIENAAAMQLNLSAHELDQIKLAAEAVKLT
ncbi:aldo/keto reductase [Pedobacter sp. L105]|uniref:aldo/keto reductase n=1 Tax=Pedobacter sp. L105 TaxID=1641871 RepID=UPI00131C0043|nr:aldo/keto reductase [Pedobacter sp. L105]